MNIKISFIVLKSRSSRQGVAPIYCLISNSKDRVRFSTKISVAISDWDAKRQRVRGKSDESIIVNQSLENLKKRILNELHKSTLIDDDFRLAEIIEFLKGKRKKNPTALMEVYRYKFNQMAKAVGLDYTKSTLSKYSQMANAVHDFIKKELGQSDILLAKLNRPFLDELELFLRTSRGMKPISSNKVIQGLKSIVLFAIERQWIEKNPFIGHRFKKVETEIKFLTKEEIETLEKHCFAQPRLQSTKQIFLFSIYTGLHYSDAMSLTKSNIINGADGKNWIEYVRGKTGKRIQIPLLNKAEVLLVGFENKGQSEGYLLPRISNQKMNSYLKEIADILDFNIPLTHKIARKTFGSILLFHDVPIKVVSELMGHSSTLITERHYAKLDKRKLGEAMSIVDKVI